MYDPFGEDEEDFNICDLLERHLRSKLYSLKALIKSGLISDYRACHVYVSDGEDSVDIMDLVSESAIFINNNDLKESLMSNIQDIKGVRKICFLREPLKAKLI